MDIEIAIPYWGDPAYMRAAVESILAQTDPGWRLLVVDDCYPDPHIADWLRALADERIRYVRNESNLGINVNFQRCLDLATGDRVTFMGADDLLTPDYVRLVREAASVAPEPEIVQVGIEVIDEDGQPFLPLSDRIKAALRGRPQGGRRLSGESLAASLLIGDWLYWPSLSFRRDAVRGRTFRTDLPIILDLALILDILVDGGVVAVDDRLGFRYRRHRKSLSSEALLDGSRFADERRFFAETAQRMTALGWRKAARRARGHLTSRLYAGSLLPSALLRRDLAGVRTLLRHLVAPA